jgi:hypothetical protein
MPAQRGLLRLHVSVAGTVQQVIATLAAIEDAYLQIYAANLLLDKLSDAYSGKRHKFPPFLEFGIYPWPLESGFPFSTQQIRERLLLAEDELLISSVEISSPGFWEFLGTLNPLDQLRKYLCDRHERNKDKEYRNKTEATKLKLENELLAVEVFSERVEALKRAGFDGNEIRRLLLPAANALNNVAEIQDAGLIDTAEVTLLEDKRPDDKKHRPMK